MIQYPAIILCRNNGGRAARRGGCIQFLQQADDRGRHDTSISERFEKRLLTHVIYITYTDKPYAKRKRRKRPRIAHTGPRSRCHRPAHELNKNVDGYEKPASLTKVGRRFLSTQSSSSDVYAYTWIENIELVHAKTGVPGGRSKVPENGKFCANDPIEALSFRGGR